MTQSSHSPSPAAGLLRRARLEGGLSQGQLAERAGVPATMVSAYERDRRQPTLPTLTRLLRAAGFDLSMHLVPSDARSSSYSSTRVHGGSELPAR